MRPAPAPRDAPLPERLYHVLAQWGIGIEGARAAVIGSHRERVCHSLTRLGAIAFALVDSETKGEPGRPGNRRSTEVVGDEDCPPLRPRSLDLLLACNTEPGKQAREALAPGAWAVIAGFSWLPYARGPAQMAEQCLAGFGLLPSPEQAHGLHPSWLLALQRNGFEGLLSHSSDMAVAFDKSGWRATVMAEAFRRGRLSSEDNARLAEEMETQLTKGFPVEPTDVLHRLFVAAGRVPLDLQ